MLFHLMSFPDMYFPKLLFAIFTNPQMFFQMDLHLVVGWFYGVAETCFLHFHAVFYAFVETFGCTLTVIFNIRIKMHR